MGTTSNADRTAFHPYFSYKDLVTVYLFFIIFTAIVFYLPDKLGQKRMAVLFYKKQNNYNTVCLNYLKIFRTHDLNVIRIVLLLFIVKTEIILIFYINKLISRKLKFLMNFKGSSETPCVDTYKNFPCNSLLNESSNNDQFVY
jgi:quinol-cytochrome oxidoreductase complex cytochrome b subunit